MWGLPAVVSDSVAETSAPQAASLASAPAKRKRFVPVWPGARSSHCELPWVIVSEGLVSVPRTVPAAASPALASRSSSAKVSPGSSAPSPSPPAPIDVSSVVASWESKAAGAGSALDTTSA